MGFRTRTSSIEVDGHIFKKGDVIYDTTAIGENLWGSRRFDFGHVGLKLSIVDIVVNEDGAFLECYTESGSPVSRSVYSSGIWCKKENALEYVKIKEWVYADGEEKRQERWGEFCDKVEELKRKDRRTS